MSGAAVHLFQIAYSPATLAAVEPGYAVLDNVANPRPDWYEFLPIRGFLQAEALDDAAFYAFFSPKFGAKTGWSCDAVRARIAEAKAGTDVVLFSAHPNQIALFVNVFEQGEYFHAGLRDACRQWLLAAGFAEATVAAALHAPMDVRQSVFCNYFAARPAFWRAWLMLGDSLLAACEGPPSPLRDALTASTSYTGGAQMKIFVMERLASLLLALQADRWQVEVADPYAHGRWPNAMLAADPTPAICSDALKHAHRVQGFPEYMNAFGALRQQVLGINR